MAFREKDQADFDLETFVDLFDTALASDNPTVRRAFKNLLMVSAIVQAEESPASLKHGPLRRLVEDIKHLNQRLSSLEGAGAYRTPYSVNNPNTGQNQGYYQTNTTSTTSASEYWKAIRDGQVNPLYNNPESNPL